MVSNFLARVQRGKLWFSDDVELFNGAQHAHLGHWGEGWAPVNDPPGDGVVRPPVLQVPDVCAQDSFTFVLSVSERLVVVSVPRLPLCPTAPNIGLCPPLVPISKISESSDFEQQ